MQPPRLFARFPVNFLRTYFSPALGGFPIPGRAITIHALAFHAFAIHALAIHTLAFQAITIHALAFRAIAIHAATIRALAIHALAIHTIAIRTLAVLARTVFLLTPLNLLRIATFIVFQLAPLVLLFLVRLLLALRQRGQRNSKSEQDGSGCDPNSHGVLLACIMYRRARPLFNSILSA
jgi:hypothetical protein